MHIKSNFKSNKVYHSDLLKLVNNLIDSYNNIDIALTEKLYSVDKEQYQFISRLLKIDPYKRTERMFLSLLFKDIYKTELLSAKAGQIAFLFALHFTKNIIKSNLLLVDGVNEQKLLQQNKILSEKFKTLIEENFETATENDLSEMIESICQNKILSDVCKNALQLSGLEGKIFIENTKSEQYIIESKTGYSFNLKPYTFFLKNNLWQQKEVKVLVVDGFIENVSEIDSIINTAFTTKQPLVLISQGFSEEVVSTLYVNYEKGNLNIFPLRLKPDISSINVINDISVVCGMEPVSTLKGQVLTFVKWDELPTIEKIMVTSTKTTIENTKTRATVNNQVRMLMEKRNEKHIIEDVQDIIDSRIKNLSSNSVVINLPNLSTISLDEQRVKIDNVLRQTKTILNFGFTKTEKFNQSIEQAKYENILEQVFYKSLKETLKKDKYPLLSVYLGVSMIARTILMFLTASGAVELEFITE